MELTELSNQVATAYNESTPLNIVGGGSKAFLGNRSGDAHQLLSLAAYSGVIDYFPDELVLRVKAGTRVADLVAQLSENNQMLAFDPPAHSDASTIGGVIAAGVSGSRRPYAGAAKDYLLGVGVLLQDGNYCEFGGQVMKNVAGYDVSRLMCGSMGTLGVIVDVSLKVLPKPGCELSLSLEMTLDAARDCVTDLISRVSGLSASCYEAGKLSLRFSGFEQTVRVEVDRMGGEGIDNSFWSTLDIQYPGSAPLSNLKLSSPELSDSKPSAPMGDELWRLSTHANEPISHEFPVMDWGFSQRWLVDPSVDPRQDYAGEGHWTRFIAVNPDIDAEPFHPLDPVLTKLHQRVKQNFDARGIFNPGRMYKDL